MPTSPFVVTRDLATRQRRLEALKEDVVGDWLCQIRMRPALERLASDHGIGCGGHDDHRHGRARRLKALQQFQAAHARHPNIGDKAVKNTRRIGRQEGFGPVKGMTGITHNQKEIGEGITDGLLVIHDRDGRRIEQAGDLCCCGPAGPTS